ncbi:MAG: DUF2147 domain-containing protein [Alphaproteobacteria bacterium]|nr:DUF2147 domain-containing protein [Alphaproteobacteria bacterium]
MVRKPAGLAAMIATAGFLWSILPADAGGVPTGTWRMANGKVTVRISNCGGRLCGTIVGLKKPLDKKGRPKRDKDNPNPALRSRPVIGITILNGLKPDGDDEWAGAIYNPDDGNTYKSIVRVVSPTRLKVKGCVAFVCKSTDFHKMN